MIPLYVVSNESYSGKSSICAGLGLVLKEQGFKVGYFKPVGNLPTRVGELVTDEDALFIYNLLGLQDALEDLSPVVLTAQLYRDGLMEDLPGLPEKILSSFERIGKDKDILLVEGARCLYDGLFLGISVVDLYERLACRILLVVRYDSNLVDVVLSAQKVLGDSLMGVIINKVPKSQFDFLNDPVRKRLAKHGIHTFGIIFRDPTLSSVSIQELAEHLGGKILCAEDKKDELVEAFMVGAMGQEQALRYFRRKANKAVITGGDRADVQLAALETPTKCLILTGNLYPSAIILARAEELGVPMILVECDTFTAVGKTEELVGRVRVHEMKKVEKFKTIVTEYVDTKALLNLLGLARDEQ